MFRQIIFVVVLLSIVFQLQAQDYKLKKYVIGSSAQSATSDAHNFDNTAGQAVIGLARSSSNAAGLGFWYNENMSIAPSLDELTISFQQGWQMISRNLIADSDLIAELFAPIENDIAIIKNTAGNFYIPPSFDNIGDWVIEEAYSVYAMEDTELTIEGLFVIPSNYPISMQQGWQMIAYLRNSSMAIEDALETITEDGQLAIVKNSDGQFYIPLLNFNNIGNMNPGEGYNVFMLDAETLTYPNNNQMGKISITNLSYLTPSPRFLIPEYTRTGTNMTLLVDYPNNDGTEIGVYDSENQLIGSGVVHKGIAGINIWGKDEFSEMKNGAFEKEELKLKALNNNELHPINIINIRNFINQAELGELVYEKNAVFRGIVEIEGQYAIQLNIDPNPVSEIAYINIILNDNINGKLEIYNTLGQRIAEFTPDNLNKGVNNLSYRMADFTNGEYLLVFKTNDFTLTKSFIIVK